MRRKPLEFRFDEEAAKERAILVVAQEVPLSLRYSLGPRPPLVPIDGDFALAQFPSGAWMERVPLRELVEDSGNWKRRSHYVTA